jgi:hypothetical protein
MPGIVVEIKPVIVVMNGIEFMQYGNYYLDADKSLGDTCLGMRRDGLLRRVERGWYVRVTHEKEG